MKSITSLQDHELLALLLKRKGLAEKAFNVLYTRYSSSVYGYCFSMVKNKELAEDIFQEAFLKFFNHVKEKSDVNNVLALLITISRNLINNYYRDKRTLVRIDEVELTIVDDAPESNEMFNLILDTLEKIDIKYSEVFILKEIDGLSYSEICDILSINMSNAKSRVARTKMKLVEMLAPYIEEINVTSNGKY